MYLGCNRLFALDSGLQSPEELVGKTDFDMVWEEQAATISGRRPASHGICYAESQLRGHQDYAAKATRYGCEPARFLCLIPMAGSKASSETYEDITERKCSEEALRSSEERYASVIAATQDGIFDWDLVRGSGYASERWQQIHGLSGTNILRIDVWKRCVHPDDLARVPVAYQGSSCRKDAVGRGLVSHSRCPRP